MQEVLKNIFWLGHASFKIKAYGLVIYIDPYQIKEDKEKADFIFITHQHFDHCSPEDIDKIIKPSTVIVGSQKVKEVLTKKKKEVTVLLPKEKIALKGIEIEAVPAYNLNKNFHPREENNLGFIIKIKDIKIYHAGDTDFIPEMKDIKVDICLLPVGGTYTMDAREAAEAANTIKPKIAIPMHWGSIVGNSQDADTFLKLCKCKVEIKKPI
jgi:L-ascorbate metabolism protein UlaG (beta-lactamase superfamily)